MALDWKTNYSHYRHYFFDNLGSFYKKKKARVYSSFAFTLITITFFVFFAIKPTIITITQLLKQTDDQKKVSKALQEKITALKKAQDEYNLTSTKFYLLDEALPKNPQSEYLVQVIEYIGLKNQVELTGLKVDGVVLWEETKNSPTVGDKNKTAPKLSNQNEQTIEFSTTVKGNYPQLKTFLNDFIGLRRIVTVDSFGITPVKGEGQELSLNIQAKTYFLRY